MGMRRNAFDWAASMHRHPWHATNHCNTSSFADFLIREWSPGKLAGDCQRLVLVRLVTHIMGFLHCNDGGIGTAKYDEDANAEGPDHVKGLFAQERDTIGGGLVACIHCFHVPAGRPNWLHAAPFCPRYDTNRTRMPMIYENIGGAHASNILELRTWKTARALEICQVCSVVGPVLEKCK